jgi:hypothetical protein
MQLSYIKSLDGGIMKIKVFTMATVLTLLVVMLTPTSVFAATATGDTAITGNFAPTPAISITVPTGNTNMILTPSGSNTLTSTSGLVTSNVNYNVTVKDKMESTKAPGDAGKMVEWTGTAWGAGKIASVVTVNTTHAAKVAAGLPHGVTASDFTIISNAPGPVTDDNLLITVSVTTAGEPALTGANRYYRITLTFTATTVT